MNVLLVGAGSVGAQVLVPFAHGAWLADHVPGAEAHLETGEGHLSIALGLADRMIDALLAA